MDTNKEVKRIIVLLVISLLLSLLFTVYFVAVGNAKNHSEYYYSGYDYVITQMIEWQDGIPQINYPIRTTIKKYEGDRIEESEIFEDYSWYIATDIFPSVTGCLEGEGYVCYEDNLEIVDCTLLHSTYNEKFQMEQFEYSCEFTIGTIDTGYKVNNEMSFLELTENQITVYRHLELSYIPIVYK